MTCPSCKGNSPRQAFAFVTRKDRSCGCEIVTITCRVCDGAGNATAADCLRLLAGMAMRHARCLRGETTFAAAKRMGISSAQLSAIEHGKRP